MVTLEAVTRERVGAVVSAGAETERENDVVRVTPPDIPLTVTVLIPRAALERAVRVSVLVHAGVHEAGEKEAVTPLGKPLADSETL